MLTNNLDPQKGGEANFTSVWKDLAHCGYTNLLEFTFPEIILFVGGIGMF